MIENRLRVRKYYSKHRDDVLARKLIYFIKQNGRVPNYRTMVGLKLDLPSIVAAFKEWAQTADNARVEKQSRKILSLYVTDIFRTAASDLAPHQ